MTDKDTRAPSLAGEAEPDELRELVRASVKELDAVRRHVNQRFPYHDMQRSPLGSASYEAQLVVVGFLNATAALRKAVGMEYDGDHLPAPPSPRGGETPPSVVSEEMVERGAKGLQTRNGFYIPFETAYDDARRCLTAALAGAPGAETPSPPPCARCERMARLAAMPIERVESIFEKMCREATPFEEFSARIDARASECADAVAALSGAPAQEGGRGNKAFGIGGQYGLCNDCGQETQGYSMTHCERCSLRHDVAHLKAELDAAPRGAVTPEMVESEEWTEPLTFDEPTASVPRVRWLIAECEVLAKDAENRARNDGGEVARDIGQQEAARFRANAVAMQDVLNRLRAAALASPSEGGAK